MLPKTRLLLSWRLMTRSKFSLGWTGAVNGTCSLAPAGYAGEPACGAYACTGSAASCAGTNCTADLYCGPDYFCDADGNCMRQKRAAKLTYEVEASRGY